jgi:rubredoxin/uncharacterized membrane protein
MRKWECTVCGYIHEGDDPPDECPVCSADKSMFVEISADTSTTGQAPGAAVPQEQLTLLASIFATASELIVKHHLHPIAVHTPNGIVPMATVFLVVAMYLHLPLFGTAVLYSLFFVLIAMPVVFFTGYSVWQKRYQGALTSIFKIKIGASIVIALILPILVIWQVIQPEIVVKPLSGRWIYLGLSFVLLAAVGLAGHIGGRLVFGNRK